MTVEISLTPEAEDRLARTCSICGFVAASRAGLGPHTGKHRRQGTDPASPEVLARRERDRDRKRKARQARQDASGSTTPARVPPEPHEAAMALLAAYSPDERVRIADLPEIAAWIDHTVRVIELVGHPR